MNPSIIRPLTRGVKKERDELDTSILLHKRISADISKLEHNLGFNRILKIFIQTLVSVLLKSVSEWKNEGSENILVLNSFLSIL